MFDAEREKPMYTREKDKKEEKEKDKTEVQKRHKMFVYIRIFG